MSPGARPADRTSVDFGSWRAVFAPIQRLVCAAGDDEETRARKTQFVAFAILVTPLATPLNAVRR
jgi:hypothetical protein